jgi:hypothetical protein
MHPTTRRDPLLVGGLGKRGYGGIVNPPRSKERARKPLTSQPARPSLYPDHSRHICRLLAVRRVSGL